MKPQLVIDFDGTLVDAGPRDYHIYLDVMGALGRPTLDFQTYWPLRRESTPLAQLLGDPTIVDDYVKTRLAICENDLYLDLNEPFRGVDATLQRLREDYDLHLVSSRFDRIALLAELDRMRLRHRFVAVTTTTEGKIEVFRRLEGVVAVIGDTEHDVKPAKELGIKSIAVSSGIRSRKFLESLQPDVILESFNEVPSALGPVR